MAKKKPRISPEVKFKAVMEFLSGKGTCSSVARRNNISISSLWNYCADVDAAIKRVVGLDERYTSNQPKMITGRADGKRHDCLTQGRLSVPEVSGNELVIHIKVSAD